MPVENATVPAEPGDTRLPQSLVDRRLAGDEFTTGGEVLVGIAAGFDARQRIRRGEVDDGDVRAGLADALHPGVDGNCFYM